MWQRMANAGKCGISLAIGGSKRIHIAKHWRKIGANGGTREGQPCPIQSGGSSVFFLDSATTIGSVGIPFGISVAPK
jgi:hypothetical protein